MLERYIMAAAAAPTGSFWWKRVPALLIRIPRKSYFHHVTRLQRNACIRLLPNMQHILPSCIAPFTAVKKDPMPLRNVNSKASDDHSSSSGVTRFVLKDIGEGIAEVELLRWFVAPGDHLTQFQKVCEVQSDKATVEITSRFEGTVLELKHDEGGMIPTGSVLLTLTPPDGVPSPSPLHGKTATTPQILNAVEEVANTKTERSPKILTTPSVRKLLRENNLDATCVRDLIPASGPGGRLLKSDVLSFLECRDGAAASDISGASRVQGQNQFLRSSSGVVQPGGYEHKEMTHSKLPGQLQHELDKSVKLNSIQKAMVRSMDSALSIPHMLFCDEIIVDQLLDTRNELRRMHAEDFPILSYLPILIKAISLTLSDYPQMNSSLSPCQTEILLHSVHNIGIAIDSPRGLVVPCIRGVQNLSIFDIAKELCRLRERATDGKLSQDDLGIGNAKESRTTFSISNIGSLGGTYCSPIITPPQVGIAALGRIRRVPQYLNDDSNEVVAVKILNVSYSADHRVLDGATMARFSNRFKLYVERPTMMLSSTR